MNFVLRAFKTGSKALALACGALLSLSTFAVTQPAITVSGYTVANAEWLSVDFWKSTPSAACEAFRAGSGGFTSAATAGMTCSLQPGNQQFSIVPKNYLGCPDDTWTFDGSSCTKPDPLSCKSGQYEQDGQCKCESGSQIGDNGDCCPTSADGAPSMQWCYVQNEAATSCDSNNDNGCGIRCSNVTFQLPKGDSVVLFPAIALGQGCKFTGAKVAANSRGGGSLNNYELDDVKKATKTPDAAKTPSGCLASGQGYVTSSSGVTSCVPSGGNGTVVKKSSEQSEKSDGNGTIKKDKSSNSINDGKSSSIVEVETVTNPDGSKSIKKTTTKQNPDGSFEKQIEVEELNPDGSTKSSSSEKSTNTPEGFCAENPNSPMCKEQKDLCIDHPDRAGCLEMGTPSDGDVGALRTENRGVSSISIIPFATNETCPADIPLPHNLSISWGPICTGASWLKPIVLAFAWLSAGLILVGAFRES